MFPGPEEQAGAAGREATDLAFAKSGHQQFLTPVGGVEKFRVPPQVTE
jgi:hypothetical protein